MISVNDGDEFTVLIADLIETLATFDRFVLKVWVNGGELPFKFKSEESDFLFMQDGIKVSTGKMLVEYLFYDMIAYIDVFGDRHES